MLRSKKSIHDNSEINIGIIGPEELVAQTKETLKAFPNFKPHFSVIKPGSIITEAAKDLMYDVDVLMFTEYHLYNLAKQFLDFPIPVHHVPLMGTGLYRSLFLIKNRHGLKNLSIDTIEKKYVEKILVELGEENSELTVFQKQSNPPLISDIVGFHVENHIEHGAISLTGIQEVSKRLAEMNIPYEWVTPTQQDMIVSLERALLATETRRNKESQIVFGLINVDDFKRITEKYHSEHDVQLLKLNIQQMLLDYIKQLDGHLINLGGEEYSFITTRGIFERETRGYKFIPLLQETNHAMGITLSIGVGFGSTAAEAGSHARLALRQAKDSGGDVCYIVRENRSVLGPVDITTNTQYERYDLAITEPELLDRAEKAGMSASYMTKLMARVERYGIVDYTAQELASTLNITVRSAHRILLKWMDAELVDIVGEEKLTHKGRPRRIYRLSFTMDEKVQ
jgi:GGDEF domain-containing protein/predicted transcriptional regulator